jgi:alkylation response protein AidB-like acyl-CoA dehydrogenase
MDFTFTSTQQEATALAAKILGDRCTPQRLHEVESSDAHLDRDLWRELGAAGLLGLALPEEHGGADLGLLELCSVLVEVGRVVAPLPLAWHGPTALGIARFGTPEQRAAWLPAAALGESVLTFAHAEDRADHPDRPTTTATPQGESWRLSGTKTAVPSGTVADLFVVPADTPEGLRAFLVLPSDPGVRVEPQVLNDGDTVGRLELDDVELGPDRLLGGADTVAWLGRTATVCLCALQLGVVRGALTLTAAYAGEREQFGRPIGTFQAVSQRLADGYIDAQGLELTLWQAAWRLSEELPAAVEVATAKLWAADAGHRTAHTTVHVHGGVGIDLDGPAHRYFTAAKRHELTLGGATEQGRTIGRALAADPA